MNKFWVPNTITAARLIFSPVITWYAYHGDAKGAFWSAIICALTDVFDGYAAKHLHAETKFGEQWMDPIADFMMALSVLAGWIWFNAEWHTERMFWAFVIILLTVVCKLFKQQTRHYRLQGFAHGFLPFFYCTQVMVFLYLYALNAFGRHTTNTKLVGIGLVVAIVLCTWKRHRFADWWNGFRRTFNPRTQ